MSKTKKREALHKQWEIEWPHPWHCNFGVGEGELRLKLAPQDPRELSIN